MSHVKSTLLSGALLLTIAFPLTAPAAGAPQTPTPLQVVVQYKSQESVSLHEPVVILFSVRNNLSRAITLTLGAQHIEFFEFSLTSPTGEAVQEYWNAGREVDMVSIGSGKIEVAPGAEYKMPLLMNRWFHFNAPETYFLTARLTTKIDVSGGSGLVSEEETIRLTIKPRDPARLEKVCADLVREVAATPNAESARDAALRLSYIDDPVAIPYLAKLFDYARLTDNLAVRGLERIGTDDAARVLLFALNSGLEDRAELSRWALTRMLERISDPHLKEAVKHALALKSND